MEISSNALKALIATIRDSTASLVEAAVTPLKTPPLEPGSDISGVVLEKQPNGRYLVRVGEEVFDMPLPRNTPTGKTLQMTYVGDQPRITFSIPQSAVKGPEVSLSGASRWLGSLKPDSLPPADAEGPTAARTARLFDTPPVDRGAMVQRLRDAVSRSGLFYESHLVRWSENSFPLNELLKEPQGQRSPLLQQEPATAPTSTQPPPSAELPKPQVSAVQAARDSTAASAPQAQEEVEAGPKGRPDSLCSKPGNRPAEPSDPSPGQPEKGETATNNPQGKTLTDGRTIASAPPPRSAPEPTRTQPAAGQSTLTAPPLPPSAAPLRETGLFSNPAPASPDTQGTERPGGEALPTGQGSRAAAPSQESLGSSTLPPLSPDNKPLQLRSIRPETPLTLSADSPADPAAEIAEPGHHAVRNDATRPSLPDDKISLPQVHTPRIQADLSIHRQYAFVSPEPGGLEAAAPQSRESSLPAAAKNHLLPFEPPDSHTLPIIRQQLELLQSGQFVWQGESWQGQQLEWMIQHDGKRKTLKSGKTWETSLKLDLPALGPVSAKVHLSGGEVRISIVVSNENSTVKMDVGRKRLLEGMESAGLHLVSMEVRHEPAP